jgi:hypothetical protein
VPKSKRFAAPDQVLVLMANGSKRFVISSQPVKPVTRNTNPSECSAQRIAPHALVHLEYHVLFTRETARYNAPHPMIAVICVEINQQFSAPQPVRQVLGLRAMIVFRFRASVYQTAGFDCLLTDRRGRHKASQPVSAAVIYQNEFFILAQPSQVIEQCERNLPQPAMTGRAVRDFNLGSTFHLR